MIIIIIIITIIMMTTSRDSSIFGKLMFEGINSLQSLMFRDDSFITRASNYFIFFRSLIKKRKGQKATSPLTDRLAAKFLSARRSREI